MAAEITASNDLSLDAAKGRMLEFQNGLRLAHLLYAVADLGVADQLTSGPLPVDEIAKRVDAHPGTLYRAMRAIASRGVFTEVAPSTFALNTMAETLRSDIPGSMRDHFRYEGQPALQQAYAALGHSIRTGQCAFEQVHGTDLFSYLTARPELGQIFNNAMGELVRHLQSAAVETYDLSEIRRIVDIGGGHGYLVARILQRYPEMRGVVFDLPEVVPGATEVLTEAGVIDRSETFGGDYLTSVPAGADAYVISHVAHQLSDADAITVLKNIREVMDPDGRVVILDPVIPEGDIPHPGKFLDIVMLALTPGRERTEAEFAGLFRAAGLRHVETVALSAPSSVIVAMAD
ncbi:methyltransferase [Streptomyces sp. NPDC017993]|uniref:methyltransferase n=1 Tax=Streptomyces sp. NPDC017993 TaxID=3365027 RepID=UPI0037A93CFD